MFKFHHSHFNQQEFEQLAQLFLKYTMAYATSNLMLEK